MERRQIGSSGWYGVRCVFRWTGRGTYEERITLWRATSAAGAIALAEAEAAGYAEDTGVEYTGLAQCYEAVDVPGPGAEVFSLLRDSPLEPDAYLDRYFDDGGERQLPV
ncbi:hypothetical protein AB0442_35775 [Kitasatospora sp. NPDC085895]|uniref:hypothetical protein n=1 Tax=Kitasatospora sp. NPDC085895 TaxID=3155057 RepID=UPI00344C38CD